jgi:hypothetical protein
MSTGGAAPQTARSATGNFPDEIGATINIQSENRVTGRSTTKVLDKLQAFISYTVTYMHRRGQCLAITDHLVKAPPST